MEAIMELIGLSKAKPHENFSKRLNNSLRKIAWNAASLKMTKSINAAKTIMN
jgi:hypothetical protein